MSGYVPGEAYQKGWNDRMAGIDNIHAMYGESRCASDEYRAGWMDANMKILADARKSMAWTVSTETRRDGDGRSVLNG